MSEVRAILVISALASVAAGAGCGTEHGDDVAFETGPLMRPGDDCLRCHSADSEYPQAKRWSLAGTVFPHPDSPDDQGVAGATVVVTSVDGSALLLSTNEVGNFYTDAPLAPGFSVAIEFAGARQAMPCSPPAGNCGACHSLPPIGGPLGRLYVPGGAPEPAGEFDCATWSRR